MSSTKNYLKNSVFIFIGEFLIKVKDFIFFPIITKVFGVINFGIWSQVAVIQAFMSPMVLMGLDSATTRFASGKGEKEISQSFSGSILFVMFASLFAGGLIICFATDIASAFFGGEQNAKFVVLCAPFLMCTAFIQMIQTYHRILDKAKMYTGMKVAEAFFMLIPLVFVLVRNLDLERLIQLIIGVHLLLAIGFVVPLVKKIGVSKPDLAHLKEYLKYGVAIMPIGYAMGIINLSDRLFISNMLGMEPLGIYSAVYSLGYMVIPLCVTPFRAMYPARAADCYNNDDMDGLQSLYMSTTRMIMFFLVPATVGLVLLVKPILTLLATAEFVQGSSVILFISLGYIFHIMASYFSVSLGLLKKPKYITITIYICAGMNLILNYLLIKPFGILGAAVATCLSFMAQLGLNYYWVKIKTPIRLKFDILSFLKTSMAAVVMAFFIYQVGVYYTDTIIGLFAIVLLSALIYAAMQFLLKFFYSDDLVSMMKVLSLGRVSETKMFKSLLHYCR